MTDDSLKSILSGAGASAPVSDQAPHVDEPETLVTEGAENTIGTDHVEGDAHPDERPEGRGEPRMVPEGAIKSEREKVAKRYTEQVADFERKLAETDARWEQRMAQLVQQFAPKPPQQEAPDFFADPQAAVRAELSPLLQRQEMQREQFSQMMAADKHGEETVAEAYSWLQRRIQTNPATAHADYQRIMSAPHPYGELVRAFKQSQAQAEIGDDPAAYRERVKAEILAEIQGGNFQAAPTALSRPSAPPATMPSNFADARNAGSRSAPAWTGPPSLKDIFKR